MAPKPKALTLVGYTPALEVRAVNRELKIASWHVTQLSHWQGIRSQQVKKDHNITSSPRLRPLKNFFIFPSIDPYSPRQRAEFRAVHQNVSWINRSIKIMVAMVVGWGYTISIEPRSEDEQLEDEELDKWKQETRFSIPLLGNEIIEGDKESGMTALELEKFLINYSITMDLQAHMARAYRFTCEQGQCAVVMLPEGKFNEDGEEDPDGKYVLPRVLRTIRPEHTTKIWLDLNTGEMSSLQIIGLTTLGGKMPVERLIWFMSDFNLELNSDFYGESKILPLLDAAKTQAIMYGKDFPEAAQYTWHQPKVFQVQIPPRDYKKVSEVLKDFLRKNNNSAGRDIAVTQNVELISGSSNPGDIAGLIQLDDHLIDQEAGFFNIPPFLLSKGKAGNLGGNAQKEEIDAFLNVEVRPQQEITESTIEKQFLDRILSILFDEPNIERLPIRATLNLIKPDLQTLFDKEQYEILLDMVGKKLISEDKMIEHLNLEDAQKGITFTKGGDPNPAENVFWHRRSRKRNPHWETRRTNWKAPVDLKPAWNDRPQIMLTTDGKEVKSRPNNKPSWPQK